MHDPLVALLLGDAEPSGVEPGDRLVDRIAQLGVHALRRQLGAAFPAGVDDGAQVRHRKLLSSSGIEEIRMGNFSVFGAGAGAGARTRRAARAERAQRASFSVNAALSRASSRRACSSSSGRPSSVVTKKTSSARSPTVAIFAFCSA